MFLTDRATIKYILEKHGFTFSKSMGQNFLINPSVCPRMAEESDITQDVGVLEIGPGIGVLTQQLAMRAKKVVCIELDKRLPAILAETLSDYDNVKVICGDVMEVDLHQIIKEEFEGMKVVVCANLPYYITTPILMRLLEEKLPIESITVMVQKEAAIRLCAPPGNKECGAISGAVCYYSIPEKLFLVSPGSFMPPPKVESQVMKLSIRKTPAVTPKSEEKMFLVIKSAFSQRRKKAINSISSCASLPKEDVEKAFVKLGLDENIRAEKLTLEQFSDLSDELY